MPLTPHSGPLGEKKAAHLLRRCTFNVTPKRIRDFALLTAEEAVEYLFNFNQVDPAAPDDPPPPPPNNLPINPDLLFPHGPLWQYDGALMHPPEMGAAKVNHVGGRYYYNAVSFPAIASALSNDNVEVPFPFENGCGVNDWENCNYLTATYLITGVYSWRMYEAINDTSIRWKLVFWINSLFTTAHERQHYHFPHWKLMYDFVNGVDVTQNFVPNDDTLSTDSSITKSYANSLKALAFAMTYSNEMLLYLDNNQNNKNGPNENYAREFLELFTILKDPNSTIQGNYVNYTEHDVSEAARVLTGFVDERHNFDSDAGRPWGKKVLAFHDRGNKTFSSAFGGHTIEGIDTLPATANEDDKLAHMDKELWEFIHMVFNQDTNAANPNPKPTAYSFVRRMYRYFVSDKIDEVVECNIIKVLADDLYDANNSQEVNFLYVDVLKNLLKSEHFYADGTQPLSCDSNCNLPEPCNAAGPCNSIIGSKLKSPLELLLTSINLFEIRNSKLDTLAAFYKANKNSFDTNGYINGDRENQIIYFKSSAPVNYAGPFVKNSPEDIHPQIPDPDGQAGDTIDDPDYIAYNYGVQGAGYEDILQLLYQHISPDYDKDSRNFIREVFHSYMFRQFGVPLQLCSYNLKGPATVEGYRGYYKEPNYSKNWLDSNNFYNRYSFGRTLIDGKQRLKGFDGQYEDVEIQYTADLIGWSTRNVDQVSELNIADPKDVVETMLKYLLAIPPLNDSERFNYFLRVFVRDLPDMDWQVAWFSHPAEKAAMPLVDTEAEKALKNLCYAITESHEFQTF